MRRRIYGTFAFFEDGDGDSFKRPVRKRRGDIAAQTL